jgi:sulfide dehydrogenase [flavocytochrome c] flavoprotein subunit
MAASLAPLLGCHIALPKSRLEKAHVLILGGGFAGLSAASTLKRLAPDLAVTLIERSPCYVSCPGSNFVVAGLAPIGTLTRDYGQLARTLSINLIHATVAGVHFPARFVTLEDGSSVSFDRLIVAPGIDFRWDAIDGYSEHASSTVPHAWKAGQQTLLLQRQLNAMRDGGVVVITSPDNPYRCPPGPYERASLIAHYLKRHKPRSKILIIDAKTAFSKQAAFMAGWRQLYPGMIDWISAENEGHMDHVDISKRVIHTEFNSYRADVLNIIPPQKAGRLAQLAGLTDESGWCPIDPLTFESRLVPNAHVIGDACNAIPMPKSAFSARTQAQACAAAVVSLLQNKQPDAAKLINHCYSFLDSDNAISVSAVYGYDHADRHLKTLSYGETSASGDWRGEAIYAHAWFDTFTRQTFGGV